VKWLTVADVLLIHQRVTQETGGEGGLLKRDSLEACVARPLASFDDQEVYPDLLVKQGSSSDSWNNHRALVC
jgi:death-on-curing protein